MELLNYHHDEKIGMLQLSKTDCLNCPVSNCWQYDIGEVRILLKDAKNVYREYRMRLSRQLEELEKFEQKHFLKKIKSLNWKQNSKPIYNKNRMKQIN